MSMKQKDFVVAEVERVLGNRFIKNQTNALLELSKLELELVKESTFNAILNGTVEYSKKNEPVAETRSYARSLVMNHLKKAKELNGNMVQTKSNNKTVTVKAKPKLPRGLVLEGMPQELQDFASRLV